MKNIGFGAMARYCFMILSFILLSGCASFYVDGSVKQVTPAQFKKPESAHPVQVLFDFQTKGVSNANVTSTLGATITDQIKQTGLFSEVSSNPVAGGALLSVTLNNVPISDDAFSKGFVTGFTFGLVGSQVSDGYICTVRYNNGNGSNAIVKQGRHAIHTTIGASASPANTIKADSALAAVNIMTRQILSNVLNDMSQDSNFK